MRLRSLQGAAAVLVVLIASTAVPQSIAAQPGLEGGFEGSLPRHRQALLIGIPAPYTSMRDPLPNTAARWRRGATVYIQKCASCHGLSGRGEGPNAQLLTPPPANLAWFARLPISKWDAFIYWTIAEGGLPFRTAMPAFKNSLSKRDIWAVTAYIRETLGGRGRPLEPVSLPQ